MTTLTNDTGARTTTRTFEILRPALVAGDALVATVVLVVAAGTLDPAYGRLSVAVPLVLTWLLVLTVCGGYDTRRSASPWTAVRDLPYLAMAHAVVCTALMTVTGTHASALSTGFVAILTTATSAAMHNLAVEHRPVRLVVAGRRRDVQRVLAEVASRPRRDYTVVGTCLPSEDAVARATDLAADAVLVVPCRRLGPEDLRRLGWRLERSGTELLVASGLSDVTTTRARMHLLGQVPVLHVRSSGLARTQVLLKGAWERLAAALALLLISPLMLLLVVAVKLDSPGPAFFRQVRVGRDDRPFTIWKLRTMTVDAEARLEDLVGHNETDGALFKIRADPRITRIGGFLRKSSLDELPQLLNVVLGQMALVGPRPALPEQVAAYEPDARRRLAAKPGITGLWQVSGRSNLSWAETVRLDQHYVDNWSFRLDLVILLRTVRVVLMRSGAY